MKRIPRLNKVLLLLYFHPEYRQSGLERRPSFKIPTENSERVRSSYKRILPGYLDFLQEPYTVLGNFFLGAEDRISLSCHPMRHLRHCYTVLVVSFLVVMAVQAFQSQQDLS